MVRHGHHRHRTLIHGAQDELLVHLRNNMWAEVEHGSLGNFVYRHQDTGYPEVTARFTLREEVPGKHGVLIEVVATTTPAPPGGSG